MKVLFLFCDAILLAVLPGPTPFFHFIARAACNLNISGKIGFIHKITVHVSVAPSANKCHLSSRSTLIPAAAERVADIQAVILQENEPNVGVT